MGELIDGKWKAGWYPPDDKGAFERPKTKFHGQITADGSTEFRAAKGRYHLYACYACPWAHRTLITRAVRGLEDAISVTHVEPRMSDDGWEMKESEPDTLLGTKYLRDVYRKAKADYSGRVTVPVLWDKQKGTIVNNESREVMRMLDTQFEEFASNETLAPPELVPQIDEILDAIYEPINNGVYRAGFATKQAAYEEAVGQLFEALERWEAVLGKQRYLTGDRFTEADVALYTTLLRFDVVYYAHFKCNVKRIQDLPNLWGFLRDVYQMPAVKKTCLLDEIKTHYYWSQTTVNPTRIVPVGPRLDLDSPHGRG